MTATLAQVRAANTRLSEIKDAIVLVQLFDQLNVTDEAVKLKEAETSCNTIKMQMRQRWGILHPEAVKETPKKARYRIRNTKEQMAQKTAEAAAKELKEHANELDLQAFESKDAELIALAAKFKLADSMRQQAVNSFSAEWLTPLGMSGMSADSIAILQYRDKLVAAAATTAKAYQDIVKAEEKKFMDTVPDHLLDDRSMEHLDKDISAVGQGVIVDRDGQSASHWIARIDNEKATNPSGSCYNVRNMFIWSAPKSQVVHVKWVRKLDGAGWKNGEVATYYSKCTYDEAKRIFDGRQARTIEAPADVDPSQNKFTNINV